MRNHPGTLELRIEEKSVSKKKKKKIGRKGHPYIKREKTYAFDLCSYCNSWVTARKKIWV